MAVAPPPLPARGQDIDDFPCDEASRIIHDDNDEDDDKEDEYNDESAESVGDR